jgi:hypothetical protein
LENIQNWLFTNEPEGRGRGGGFQRHELEVVYRLSIMTRQAPACLHARLSQRPTASFHFQKVLPPKVMRIAFSSASPTGR